MIKKFLLVILLSSTSLFAQNAGTIIKKVQNKFNSVRSFSAEIVRTSENKKQTLQGNFYYYKPDYYKIVLPQREIISIADTIWNFEKNRKRIVVSQKDESISFFDIRKILFEAVKKFNIKIVKKEKNSKDKCLLKLFRKNERGFQTVFVEIGKNYFVRSVEVATSRTNKIRFEFKRLILNKVKKSETFKVRIPSNWKVIDLR
jgi:outer membrane lipoprotein-sorting protein